MKGKKTILMILDGWGHGDQSKSDAIFNADTPFIDSLYNNTLSAELLTHGAHVGLPDGQMGNSEVGHLNIGAGRIVFQDLAKINNAIKNNELDHNEQLLSSFHYCLENNKPLHLMGLVSDGGIHSHNNHIYEICRLAEKHQLKEVYIHAFSDGRDTDPKSALGFIEQLQSKSYGAKIASLCGRYYAMDRDNRWERIKLAYDLIVNGKGVQSNNILESIQSCYKEEITDEFIKPIVCVDYQNKPIATIKNGDGVICFNFRTDRCREISTVLTQQDKGDLGMSRLDIHYTTMTEYDKTFENVNVIFKKDNLKNTLGEVLANHNLHQIRIAETEKYPHVTFFFSGGRELAFDKESRLMAPSPKVATYDLMPEMSAQEIVDKITPEINKKEVDFVCLNFANPDMVGHTGNYQAIKKAVETVDKCAKDLVEIGVKNDYAFVIIADHGNADYALNQNGSPNTAHTTNPVPCFVLNTNFTDLENGKLADIAPTILKIMEVEIPTQMTGNILVK
jgi:2,3-bisphosphoglycerate-independent phosphoglycerate mutase